MKELKFRLRDRHNKLVGYEKWYPGSFNSEQRYWKAIPCWLYSEGGQYWNPTPIGHRQKDQYTGLKDMEQKEGYHHDLFCHDGRNGGRPIEIVWEDGSWMGQYVGTDLKFPLNQSEMDEAEIIGNIYEK